tara:strand:+ start:1026 stop:2753 length:1728 start_codon:yes stop_codon:yes gene_type:complete
MTDLEKKQQQWLADIEASFTAQGLDGFESPKASPVLPNLNVPKRLSPYGLSGGSYQNQPEYVQGSNEGRATSTANAIRYGAPIAASILAAPAAGVGLAARGVGMAARAGIRSLGGAGGETAAQGMEISSGTRDKLAPGAIAGAGIATGLGIAKGAVSAPLTAALGNSTAEFTRQLVDEDKMDVVKLVLAGGLGLAGGGLSRALSKTQLTQLDDLRSGWLKTFKPLRDKGMTVNPSTFDRGGMLKHFTTNEKINVASATKNQAISNSLTREELGLPASHKPFARTPPRLDGNRPVVDANGKEVRGELDALLFKTQKPYRDIGTFSAQYSKAQEAVLDGVPSSAQTRMIANIPANKLEVVTGAGTNVKKLREVRAERGKAFKEMKAGSMTAEAKINAANAAEKELEALIDEAAELMGKKGLLESLIEARKQSSKIYNVKDAVHPASGNVDIEELMRASERGVPLTGRLRQLADFATIFGENSKVLRNIRTPEASSGYLQRQAIGGTKMAAPAAAAAVSDNPAARALMSESAQNKVFRPNVEINPTALSRAARVGAQNAGRDQQIMADMIRQRQEQGR